MVVPCCGLAGELWPHVPLQSLCQHLASSRYRSSEDDSPPTSHCPIWGGRKGSNGQHTVHVDSTMRVMVLPH